MTSKHTILNTNADKENKAPTATLASTPLLHYIGVISNKSEPELQVKTFFNDLVQISHSHHCYSIKKSGEPYDIGTK
jgi:hypothetical protein